MRPNLKQIECPPECGFLIRSHDEREMVRIVMDHSKAAHNKPVTESEVRKLVQSTPVIAR